MWTSTATLRTVSPSIVTRYKKRRKRRRRIRSTKFRKLSYHELTLLCGNFSEIYFKETINNNSQLTQILRRKMKIMEIVLENI